MSIGSGGFTPLPSQGERNVECPCAGTEQSRRLHRVAAKPVAKAGAAPVTVKPLGSATSAVFPAASAPGPDVVHPIVHVPPVFADTWELELNVTPVTDVAETERAISARIA